MLNIRPFSWRRQWTSHSCVPAVLQIVVLHFGYEPISHRDAIRTLGSRPDGTTFAKLCRELRKRGIPTRAIRNTATSFRRILRTGGVVVLNDTASYRNDHAYLVCGISGAKYWVLDPMLGFPTRRRMDYVHDACDECYGASLPSASPPLKRRAKPRQVSRSVSRLVMKRRRIS